MTLTVRHAYSLFPQNPGREEEDLSGWTSSLAVGDRDPYLRLLGAGEMLAFSAADFEDFRQPRPQLSAGSGRRNVVLGGFSIDNCTMHTTLDLLRAGYQPFVVADMSSTNNRLAEDAAIARMTGAGAVVTTWISVATELVKDWNSPAGRELMPVLQRLLAPSTVGTPRDPSPKPGAR